VIQFPSPCLSLKCVEVGKASTHGADGGTWRSKGPSGVELRVCSLPAAGGAVKRQEGGGHSKCCLSITMAVTS